MNPHFYDEDMAPDDARVIQPPIRTPEDDSAIARIRCGTVALVMAGLSAGHAAGVVRRIAFRAFEMSPPIQFVDIRRVPLRTRLRRRAKAWRAAIASFLPRICQ